MATMEPATDPIRTLALPLGMTLLFLSGGIIIEVEGAPLVVNGIMGKTMLLSVMVPHDQHVVEMRWKFGPDKVILGDSKGKIFKPFTLRSTNYSQLTPRLDMYNETTLRIINLTKSDGGVYKANVQFEDGATPEEEFQLNVYDAVPAPHITKELFSTTEGCNITLLCQVPDGIDLSFKWLMRDPNNSSEDQHISEGSMLNLSLNSNTPHSEYICVVTSLVDQKNTSISLQCPKGRTHVCLVIPIVVMAVILVIMAIVFIWKRKKARQRNGKVILPEGRLDASNTASSLLPHASYVNDTSKVPNGIDETQRHSENNQQNGS